MTDINVDWSSAESVIGGAAVPIFGILGVLLVIGIGAAVVRTIIAATAPRGQDSDD